MKKQILTIVFIFVLIILCNNSCSSTSNHYYIFEEIEECNNIELYKHENALVEVYSSPSNDKYLQDLNYLCFYGVNYSSPEISFEMFAYEFESKDVAQKYFENIAERESVRNPNFLMWGGIINCSLILIDGENAYYVESQSTNKDKILDYLSTIFSKNITF